MSVLDEIYEIEKEVILEAIEEDERAQKEKKLEKYANSLYSACYYKAKYEKQFYSEHDALNYLIKLLCAERYGRYCQECYSKKQGIKQICEYIKSRTCEIEWFLDLDKVISNACEINELRQKISKEFGEDVFKSLFDDAQNRATKMIKEDDEIETIFIFTPWDEKLLKETWESYLKDVEDAKKAFSDD